MESQAQDAAVERLRTALERNAEWIREFVLISGSASVLDEYLRWFFERLKDRVPPSATEQEVDHMIRLEVSSIFGRFRDRRQHRFELPVEIIRNVRSSGTCWSSF